MKPSAVALGFFLGGIRAPRHFSHKDGFVSATLFVATRVADRAALSMSVSQFFKVLCGVSVALAGAQACAANQQLEQLLLQSFKPASNSATPRHVNEGQALRELKANGVLPFLPLQRTDYTDYYRVARPFTLLGQEVVLMEEQYMTQYRGCCVNEGAGAFVRVTASVEPMRAFAKANKCEFREYASAEAVLEEVGGSKKWNLPAGAYASLTCHANDETDR